MSFLAQLHAQQSSNGNGNAALQLYYVLLIKETRSGQGLPNLQLTLKVGDRAESGEAIKKAINDGKPYAAQSQHITLPPPFINALDKAVLLALLTSPLQNGWPQSMAQNIQGFWQTLCATERVYFQAHTNAEPIKVCALAESKQTILSWQQQANGEQHLSPNAPSDAQLFKTVDHFTLLNLETQDKNTTNHKEARIGPCDLVCATSAGQMSTALSEQLRTEIFTALESSTFALSADALPAFLQKYQRTWSELGLPLPSVQTATIIQTQVRGAVECDTAVLSGQNLDVVSLEFIYLSKNYCTWFRPNDEAAHYVLLEDQLCVIQRKPELEEAFIKPFKKSCKPFDVNAKGYTSQSDNVWQNFFIQEKQSLTKNGFIFRINQRFKRHYIQAENWLSQLTKEQDRSLQVDLFAQVSDEHGRRENINLLALLDQIQQYNLSHKDGDIKLKLSDGRILLMPREHLISLTEEFGDLLVNGRGSLSFHRNQQSRLQQLENLLPNNCQWQGDTEALELSHQLSQPPKVVEQADCGVTATLRPYQWLGVCWIQHLKNCGVNGLLADDMGLGKTLQTIAHLSLEFANTTEHAPALVVVPTSLLHNWANECKKFAPHLKVAIHHGANRKKNYQNGSHQILLTSYQLIINDTQFFDNTHFSWLILDEAQNIKNPRTKTHSAIKNIQAQHKLCLSGTPVENNLVELWALLNFLMPNCLGSLNEFKFYFQKPIENDGNGRKLEQLLQRISPFMLRRTKQAVAKDLPEKTEIQQTIDLGEQQYTFYESIKNNTWQELQQSLEGTDNQGEQQLFVLSALLKLRQACCDPALLGETEVPSAKRQHCIAMAKELAAEGRGILIFSQFTTMLDILADNLESEGINYGLLTGKTRNRQALVDKFQAGEFPVFLISLKAGGVGLNLTRADTVIHYDPWWNSAAEQQAADRAHRIGQKNAVFVYKLIAENTIEEKIAALQARKSELGNSINNQAQQTGAQFSMKLEELLSLWAEEI
ncbi:MAG TPA: SNF2-related protein [Marinagarivorans sp.]